jgi:hypothetical protein
MAKEVLDPDDGMPLPVLDPNVIFIFIFACSIGRTPFRLVQGRFVFPKRNTLIMDVV